MAQKIRWGILGPGNIAKKFADGLKAVPDAELVAVGSRSRERADKFADAYGVPHRHTGYEALAADKDVDAIYVATPHSGHMNDTILCLNAGKAVLCEKPFAINAAQARRMVHAARQKKVLLMEAMWSRFLPHIVNLRSMLAEKVIGEVRMVTGDFGFRAQPKPESRLFDPALGGGGLMDVGVYPISLASMILGKPNRIASLAEIGPTGVDDQGAAVMSFPGGQLAVIWTGVRTTTPHEATILGTDGMIRILPPWWRPSKLSLKKGGKEQVIEPPAEGNGYNYEAAEFGRLLRAGKLESDVLSLDESVEVMETLDAIRAQWGLKYPME